MSRRTTGEVSGFQMDEQTIRNYYENSTEAKLEWLEEINNLFQKNGSG